MMKPSQIRLDLNLIKVFVVLFQEQNVTRTSEILGLTQPSVSNALKRLREALGDELFHRTPSGMRPTPRAEAIAPELIAMTDRLDFLIAPPQRFDPGASKATFRIGMTDQAACAFGPLLADAFWKVAPQAQLVIRPVDKDTVFRLLDEGLCEMAIGALPREMAGRFERKPIFESEHYGVLMSRQNPMADVDLDLETYLSLPHVLVSATGIAEGSVDAYLTRINRSRRVVLVVPNLLSAGIILQRGAYLCTQPASIAARLAESCGLEMRPIPLDFPTTSISLLYHQRWRNDPQQMWLRDLASKICSGHGPSL